MRNFTIFCILVGIRVFNSALCQNASSCDGRMNRCRLTKRPGRLANCVQIVSRCCWGDATAGWQGFDRSQVSSKRLFFPVFLLPLFGPSAVMTQCDYLRPCSCRNSFRHPRAQDTSLRWSQGEEHSPVQQGICNVPYATCHDKSRGLRVPAFCFMLWDSLLRTEERDLLSFVTALRLKGLFEETRNSMHWKMHYF